MTHADFNEFQRALIEEVVGMKDTEGIEYANGENIFGNFDRLAQRLGVDRKVVAWIYLTKHMDSIESFIRTGQTHSTETIRGRLVDVIVYLTLVAGMVEEETVPAVNVPISDIQFRCARCLVVPVSIQGTLCDKCVEIITEEWRAK